MKNAALNLVTEDSAPVRYVGSELRGRDIEMGRIPGVAIHAFCDSPAISALIESAATDRRMSRAQVTVRVGGIAAAVAFYHQAPTPDLIIIETREPAVRLLEQIDALADVCDIKTRLIVIGNSNDIGLYRELVKREVSEYLLAPVDQMSIIAAVSRVYGREGTATLGKVYAFIGAKGGVGSSTVAHNVAWSIGQRFKADVLLADMDMAFGTAGLNFDREPVKGIGDAVSNPDRLDEALFERLLTKCSDHVSLLAAPVSLEKTYDFNEGAFDRMLDIARATFPYVILDVPHMWTAWAKKTVFLADEVVITAMPDLPSLSGAKHLVDVLRQIRPLDAAPRLVLNQVGIARRPEINPKKFAGTLQLEPAASIASDPRLFGRAENTGKLVCEAAANSKASVALSEFAQTITGRKPLGRRGFSLGALLGRTKQGEAVGAKSARKTTNDATSPS